MSKQKHKAGKKQNYIKGGRNMTQDGSNQDMSNPDVRNDEAIEGQEDSTASANNRGEMSSEDMVTSDLDVLRRIVDRIDSEIQALQENVGYKGSRNRSTLFGEIDSIRSDLRYVQEKLKVTDYNGVEKNLGSTISKIATNVKNLLTPKVPPVTSQGLEAAKNDIVSKVGNASRDVSNVIDNKARDLSNKISKTINDVEAIKKEVGKLQDGQQIQNHFAESGFQEVLKGELKPLRNLETITGKVESLSGDMSSLKDLLESKGLEIRQKFPAANADEEVLCQLTEYGQTVLSQLSIAARHYARSKANLDKLSELKDQASKAESKGYNEGKEFGRSEGRTEVLKELLKKYSDCATLLLDNNEISDPLSHLRILADFLRSEGVHREYEPGQIVEVNDENFDELSARIENLTRHNVRIVKGDYYIHEELLQKAQWEEIDSQRDDIEGVSNQQECSDIERQEHETDKEAD